MAVGIISSRYQTSQGALMNQRDSSFACRSLQVYCCKISLATTSMGAAPATHSVLVQNPDGQTSTTATLTVVDPTTDFFIRLPQNAVQQGVNAILTPFVTGEGLTKVTKVFVGGKSAAFDPINDRE